MDYLNELETIGTKAPKKVKNLKENQINKMLKDFENTLDELYDF